MSAVNNVSRIAYRASANTAGLVASRNAPTMPTSIETSVIPSQAVKAMRTTAASAGTSLAANSVG